MNVKTALTAAAIALVGSSAAFAQSSEADLQHFGQGQASAVTRAAVQADVRAAQAAGALTIPGEVTASALPARSAGTAMARVRAADPALSTPAEVTASATPKASSISRDAVRAEARAQARADTYQDKARVGAGF